jgi:hypothetical protein
MQHLSYGETPKKKGPLQRHQKEASKLNKPGVLEPECLALKRTMVNTSFQQTNSSYEQINLSMSITSQTWPRSGSMDQMQHKKNVPDAPVKKEYRHENAPKIAGFCLDFGPLENEVAAFGGFASAAPFGGFGEGIQDIIGNVRI